MSTNIIKKEIIGFVTFNGNKKQSITSFFLTFLICFVSYSAFIVYGFASPDGVLEGFHYYVNQGWAIAGCGRWFLALVNMMHANLVFPWLAIIECVITNWLSAHTICKIFNIDNKWHYYIICILFAILPPFIEMCTYTHTAFSFSLSILFSIMYVYFNTKCKKKYIVISALFLGFAMGAYQSQIGVAVGLTVMCIIKQILDDNHNIIFFIIISLLSGLLGAVVYVVGLKVFLRLFNLVLFSRAATFSFSEIISNMFSRLIYGYEIFFSTFNQVILKRKYIFIVLFIVFCIEVILLLIDLIKKKKNKSFVVVAVLVLLLPPALNFVGILLPGFEITALMLTPNYLIIPFGLGLVNYLNNYLNKISSIIIVVCLTVLSWTYVLSANATYDCYRLSYDAYRNQFSKAMNEVLALNDYKLNETKIVVIGRPSDTVLRENINTYYYGIGLYHNLLYWETTDLDPSTTNKFIINEYSVDPGVMEYDEYVAFINLNECLNMPSWPKEGSVKMVDGCAVIKFSEPYE